MDELRAFLNSVPAVRVLSTSPTDNALWWVKCAIALEHPLAWRVVQELAHVLNGVSLEEALPSRFYPVSPPPYLNGGPELFLSWIIESTSEGFRPSDAVQWLQGRLPKPVDSLKEWELDDP